MRPQPYLWPRHYILHGKGRYLVNGKSWSLTAGNGFLITPGISTVYSADDKDPWEYCWIGFDGYSVKTILHHCGFSDANLIFTDKSRGKLKEYLMNLITDVSERRCNKLSCLGQLYLCFSLMCGQAGGFSETVRETYVEKAVGFIRHNYTYDIKISDIAKHTGIDRSYLYKLFMDEKKISPQQYLIGYRLYTAEKLLRETDLSATEIAYSCGFRDAPSFNKHFKKRLGMTPLQYRFNKSLIVLK